MYAAVIRSELLIATTGHSHWVEARTTELERTPLFIVKSCENIFNLTLTLKSRIARYGNPD